MKKIVGILLLTSMLSWGGDANPGLLDDPGCRTLIKNQLVDLKQNLKDYLIVYKGTDQTADQVIAVNTYVVTYKPTGRKMLATVALSITKVPDPTPSPSPSPTPAPMNLKIITDHV
jgi:hypothetical protein